MAQNCPCWKKKPVEFCCPCCGQFGSPVTRAMASASWQWFIINSQRISLGLQNRPLQNHDPGCSPKQGGVWGSHVDNPLFSKINFGGIPNIRNVLFFQIFLKRAKKPSAGNPVLTWPCAKDSQNLFPDLFRNLLGTPLNLTWLCTKAS